ncbi:subunit H of vacuolar H+-ATPase V1 [Ordospora colligata]|uniref:Subunit H of vacuolar H+-ATPase V1 n=1 Tax=Ordospora colligata OC4 TaxID=1354746 RepID=A0A0B2UDE7_9MICR|nr:subunit H of vacuolar H+-ATPase V1 [Ordospora colligata OC4]KHN69096.1 subunit H of vacuolar H+-ATPase V1 [Ordospora colligata OC4]TBU14551.1 subunit H of vacuolar H+-ATPase V1 [Ordospora colligata]TBU14745.1 subunit H of vacuolar H+-ATPase V1 [Ordospora colligata]TBU18179.1 subunit H of vacuolar H+-ATPase V1 [Ordospora colligata]
MFLDKLEAKIKDSISESTHTECMKTFNEIRCLGAKETMALLLSSEDTAFSVLSSSPEVLNEDELIGLLFCSSSYSRYKSAEILTRMYANKAHRKEYLSFFKQMLKDNASYDEGNYLLCLLIDFLSYKSNSEFSVDSRKLDLMSSRMFKDILNVFVFVKEVQYNALMIVLIASYSEECVQKMDKLIDDVVVVMKDKTREKILRVCYAIIANILDQGYVFSPGRFNYICRCTELVLESGYGDVDLIADLKKVKSKIMQNRETFCIRNYLNELFSGRFEDSEYHHREDFWTANLEMLMKNKVEIIKVLKKYLKSNNPSWICLACNDIFQMAKVSPDINVLLNKYQVREVLFGLVHSEDDDVKFHAIQALYMCISSEWS